jgi:hypothetical protein
MDLTVSKSIDTCAHRITFAGQEFLRDTIQIVTSPVFT